MDEITAGQYTVGAMILEKGKNGFAYFDMIVKDGIAKAIIEDINGVPSRFAVLDQTKMKKTRPGSNFECDYVYEGQINVDPPPSTGKGNGQAA